MHCAKSKVGCARQAASVNHALNKQHRSILFSLSQGIWVKGQGHNEPWDRATSQSQDHILKRFVILPISPGIILGNRESSMHMMSIEDRGRIVEGCAQQH
jgi:hypothetical protein